MKSLRRCVVGAGAVAFSMLGGARDANASGFAGRIGGEEGTPVSTNPTALYLNPAGIVFAKGSQLGMYGTLAIRHATWTRGPAPSDAQTIDAQVGNYGTATLLNAFGGPQLGGTLKLGDNFAIGAGFFAPFGGSFHWDHNDSFPTPADPNNSHKQRFPLAAAGVQRWFGMDGFLRVLYFTAGAAYRLGPLSIGVSGNFISTTLNQTQAKNLAGQGLPDSASEGRVFADVHGFNGSFAAGAMLEIIPDELYLGASYQAQPGLGTQTLEGTQTSSSPKSSTVFDVALQQNLPDIFRAGMRWRMRNAPLEFRLFGDVTRWSRFASTCLFIKNTSCDVQPDGTDPAGNVQQFAPRNFVDTWGVRLGVSYWVSPGIAMLFGAGYETAAVPDSTLAPDIFDAVNYSGTLGMRFRIMDSLFLAAEYTHIQYADRNNVGKSVLAVDASGKQVQVPAVLQDAGGIYTQWLGLVTANLEAIF